MIDWKRKLTSRKLWMAVAGLISGLVIAFNGSAETAETVAGSITALGSVIAYIVGEGLTDAAATKTDSNKDQ
jgi:hypothetical protein